MPDIGRPGRVSAAFVVAVLVGGWAAAAPAGAIGTAGETMLVSVSTTGTVGDAASLGPSFSADGRYVAFESDASNLVPGDTNDTYDVFVRDVLTGTTRLVSRNSSGTQGNNTSFYASISADGRYVAFESNASNLVPGDSNGDDDVFVRDLVRGRTRLVSRSSSGSPAGFSAGPSISADGRYVAFWSDASNLVPGDTNGDADVFVRDVVRGRTLLVSRSGTGSPANSYSIGPSISADGRYVAFASAASNLVPGDRNSANDEFVRDVVRGRTRLVSRSSTGGSANGTSGTQSVSADGRYIAFFSYASNLVPGDANGAGDVFVRDVVRGRTRLVSRSSTGGSANGTSGTQSVSADGRYVAFGSDASNLVLGDANGVGDVFVRDVVRGRTRLVSRSSTGVQGNDDSSGPSISADGRYIAYTSSANNLVAGDTNSATDVFLLDLVR